MSAVAPAISTSTLRTYKRKLPSTLFIWPWLEVLRAHAAPAVPRGARFHFAASAHPAKSQNRRDRQDAANAQVLRSKGLNGGAGVRWASVEVESLGTKVGLTGNGFWETSPATTGTR